MGEVTDLGDGRYLVAGRLAYVAGPPQARWVFLDGHTYVIDVRPPAGDSAAGAERRHDDELALASPMPATVTAVGVAPGQTVARGDVLVMLEAMKMELPIRAPRAGRDTRVACKPGELVQPGIALVELE